MNREAKRMQTGQYAVYFIDNRAFGFVGSYDEAKAALDAAQAESLEHPGYAHVVVANSTIIGGYERGRRLTDAGVLTAA